MAPLKSVIIVGAGPAGLVLALLLAQSGIPGLRVRVLEREAGPTDETRAVFYQPVSLFEFGRAGILEEVRAAAFKPRSAAWRDMADGGQRLFGLRGGDMLALTSDKLVAIAERRISGEGKRDAAVDVEILWSHAVLGVGQDDGKAWVDVERPGAKKTRMEADYVVGCDGGTSTVRRSLFGEKAMPGFTWDKQLVAVDLRYDLYAHKMEDSNLFMHPTDAWLAFRPSKDEGLWRIVYPDADGLSGEEIVKRCPGKLQAFLPGQPSEEQFEVVRARPYRIHQRIVDKMRVGRIVLASDAAHLCCPYGAFGLNGGIADVGSLYDCLMAIHEGRAEDDILDVYSDVRRDKWKTIIDPRSQGVMKFIFSDPKDVIPAHPFYQFAQRMENSPEMAAAPDPTALALRYDFSQHFRENEKEVASQ